MLSITHTKTFMKEYKKMSPGIRLKFDERASLFVKEPFHSILSRHSLHREYKGYESINVTGDYRAIFKQVSIEHFEFYRIGRHNQLYK